MPKLTPYPTEPVVLILSDGVERHLRYTLGALRRLKGVLGASLIGGKLGDMDEDKLPELIAAGLVGEKLTADQVAELIDARALGYVAQKFMEAFSGGDAERPTAAAAETPAAN